MSTQVVDDTFLNFDAGKDFRLLGRLRLPYKSFNFLALLTRGFGKDKYDKAKDMIELCQWMYIHVSDVRSIINRLSEYAITSVQIDNNSTPLDVDKQRPLLEILEKIDLKTKLIQIAKLYFTTGNVFLSLEVRSKKHLECPKCKSIYNISKLDFEFDAAKVIYSAQCVQCGKNTKMNVVDIKLRNVDDIYIKIWDWHDLEFAFNPISDEYRYYYKIPIDVYNALNTKKPDNFFLETTPHYIIKDVLTKKRKLNNTIGDKKRLVEFPHKKIKHIKHDSTLNSVMGGWGEPLLVGVLQDVFFMQLLRQAQATLLADYIIPIRIVSPDPSAVNLMDIHQFSTKFDELYRQFQKDPLQIMKAPFPVQYQTLSTEGKTLFLSNEMEYTRDCIRRGLGVPTELLNGSTQNFSGGSISLRMLENFLSNFLNSVIYTLLNDFIIPQLCLALNLPTFKVTMGKFKSMDDVQQKASKQQLYQMNMIPDTYIYEDYDVIKPSEKELGDSIKRRANRDGIYQLQVAKSQTETQADMLISQTKAQIEAQKLQQEAAQMQQLQAQQDAQANAEQVLNQTTQPNAGLQPPDQLGAYALQELKTPQELDAFMQVLQQQMPDNLDYVSQVQKYIQSNIQQNMPNLATVNEKTKPSTTGGVDVRPQPTQKPPRRETA